MTDRILVVDDEPVNREVLAQQLAKSGHEILEASNGEEALAMIAQFGKFHPPDRRHR